MTDAMMEGAEAYINGAPLDANPYDLFTQEALHFDWNDGWEHAADEAKE